MIIFDRNYKADKIIKYINSSGCGSVSFDIFDTLIKRVFAHPNDVFIRVARDAGLDNPEKFLQDRINAAHKARIGLQSGEEVTLDGIYAHMPEEYSGRTEEIKALEIGREIKCCRVNYVMKEVYDWCIMNKKRVMIISDMYLPIEVIEEMLGKCGYYGWEKLYLSSDVGVKKSTGNLFRHAIKDSGIIPAQHIHIGDAIRSDWLRAKQSGMRTCRITRHPRRSIFTGTRGLDRKSREQYTRYQEVINNNINPEWDVYYLYGFEVIGMLLYGMCCWLHERFLQRGHSKVFFIARDGYIMQEAYNMLFGENAVNNSYLYVSRASLRFPQLWKNPGLDDVFGSESPYNLWYADDVCGWLKIDNAEGLKVWQDCGLKGDEGLFTRKLIADRRFMRFYEHFRQEIMTRSAEEYETVRAYLKQEGFCGSVGIVDVGWSGHIQRYLQRYTAGDDTDIFGYYFGLKTQDVTGTSSEPFIPIRLKPSYFCSLLLEYPFTKLAGSTQGYTRDKNNVAVPVLGEYELSGTEHEGIVTAMQNGILDFIGLMRDGYGFEHVDYPAAYAKLRKATKSPSLKEANILGELKVKKTGQNMKLAAPSGILHYIIHPAELRRDIAGCRWVIGFLRRMLKISLPYDAILSLIRGRNV